MKSYTFKQTTPVILSFFFGILLISLHANDLFAHGQQPGFRSGEILIDESFDVLGEIPEGWFVQYDVTGNPGSGLENWTISNTVNAGGTAPELRFHFMPIFNAGYSRMVTPAVYVGESIDMELIFKQRLSNFTTNDNEQIAVELSTDGGANWEVLWFYNIFSSFGPEETTLGFQLDGSSDSIQIGFRFSGNSYNIFSWSIDDVLLRSTPQEDLIAGQLAGTQLPAALAPFQWELEVYNNGLSLQNDYQVKLMKVAEGDDIELASAQGVPVAPGETVMATVAWTPTMAQIGEHQVYGFIDFDDDQDQSNNASDVMPIRVLDEWALTKTVGEGKEFSGLTAFRIPFDFYYKNNLHQVIYYPEEIDDQIGPIHGLVYYSSFTSDNVEDEEVKIWIGMTPVENFVESNGFIPVTGQTLVFHQNITVPFGESLVYLPFDEPFLYTGNNLIVTSNRVFYAGNTGFDATDRYFSSNSPFNDRSIRAQSNTTIYYPQAPPPGLFGGSRSSWHPNTSFIFSAEGVGAVQGHISDAGGAPLEGALVSTAEYAITATSDQDGFYLIPNVPIGEVNLLATIFGYEDALTSTIISEGETVTVDFTMQLLQTISVSGTVAGSDQPATGLAGAMVLLDGYGIFETTTNTEGDFTLDGVFSGKSYELTISFDGYEDHTATLETGGQPIDLGTIILQEIAFPPEGVRADLYSGNQSVVFWYAPGTAPYREFRYDDGFVAGQLGYDPGTLNSTLGSVWRNEALIEEIAWYQSNAVTIHPWVTIRFFGLDENGYPQNTNVIKRFDSIPYQNFQWNTFTLPEPLYLSDGFMIGISTLGFLGLSHDDGMGEPYPFQPLTMFLSANTFSTGFTPIEDQGYQFNFMIRAYGTDYGPLIYSDQHKSATDAAAQPIYPSKGAAPDGVIETPEPDAGKKKNGSAVRSLEGYRIFRMQDGQQGDPQSWTEVAAFHTDTAFIDNQWSNLPVDTYLYAVQSVYTNQNLSAYVFSNKLLKDELTNTGFNQTLACSVMIYPNPATDNIHIRADEAILHLTIFDQRGNKAKEINPGRKQINLNITDYPAGIYYVRVVAKSGTYNHKLVIRKR
jgi:hypothetical protein